MRISSSVSEAMPLKLFTKRNATSPSTNSHSPSASKLSSQVSDVVRQLSDVRLSARDIELEVPEDEEDETEESKERQVDLQEKTIDAMFTPETVGRLRYDLEKVPAKIRFLASMGSCSHGLRTVGVCAHRTAFLKFLRNNFTRRRISTPNPVSKRNGSIAINIEGKHEWKRQNPI